MGNANKKEESISEPGVQGIIEGCRMFDEYRAKIIASLPKDLTKEEFGKQLFERIYGAPWKTS